MFSLEDEVDDKNRENNEADETDPFKTEILLRWLRAGLAEIVIGHKQSRWPSERTSWSEIDDKMIARL